VLAVVGGLDGDHTLPQVLLGNSESGEAGLTRPKICGLAILRKRIGIMRRCTGLLQRHALTAIPWCDAAGAAGRASASAGARPRASWPASACASWSARPGATARASLPSPAAAEEQDVRQHAAMRGPVHACMHMADPWKWLARGSCMWYACHSCRVPALCAGSFAPSRPCTAEIARVCRLSGLASTPGPAVCSLLCAMQTLHKRLTCNQ